MHQALDTTLQLETPEHIAFQYQLAGPARRIAAYAVDLGVRGLILLGFVLVTSLFTPGLASSWEGIQTGVLLIFFFLLEWGYHVGFELLDHGRTPGKRLFRLRVIHQQGRPVGVAESILRNLLRAADLLPMFYALGVSAMLFDQKFRRLGDLVAQTVVIGEPANQLTTPHVSSRPKRIAGLPARPILSSEERAAVVLFVRRLPRLSEARAAELADSIAPLFSKRFGIVDANPVDLLIFLAERSETK